MAGFKAHFTTGIATGLTLALGGLHHFRLSSLQAAGVLGFCVFGSILPDVDSDSSKPLRWLRRAIAGMAVAAYIWMIYAGVILGTAQLTISLATVVLLYLLICRVLKRITVHRGIIHSIPAGVLLAQIVYLLCFPYEPSFAACSAAAAFFGVLSHLVLDEMHAMNGGIMAHRAKASLGSALKFGSGNFFSTFCVYVLIVLFSVIILMKNQDEFNIGKLLRFSRIVGRSGIKAAAELPQSAGG